MSTGTIHTILRNIGALGVSEIMVHLVTDNPKTIRRAEGPNELDQTDIIVDVVSFTRFLAALRQENLLNDRLSALLGGEPSWA
ncbi:hypothetical protein FHD67_02740 [Paracoccus haeundaensis]|uniref:Uncharacterized protein n=1 Tax=Paracoccus haeundaensis TaxID=225362 RepID=A0A5C4RBA1_9RHOB|nr:hypothetical protein FHD67_02740 [Paracoccus haeundaensis]